MVRMENLESQGALPGGALPGGALPGFWRVSFASVVRLAASIRAGAQVPSVARLSAFFEIDRTSLYLTVAPRWKKAEACRATKRMHGFTPEFMQVAVLGRE
jgi:hypothetical protein